MNAMSVGKSDIGVKRDTNEDAMLIDNDIDLFIVSDGMGGHAAGEVASNMVVQSIARALRDKAELIEGVRTGCAAVKELVKVMEIAVQTACREVYTQARSEPGLAGMGATVTALVVAGRKAVMAHVGASRLYLWREGTVSLLSYDHTLAAELFRAGMQRANVQTTRLSRVLSRVVGSQPAVQVDTLVVDVVPGDRFLLCSDGFSGYLTGERWLAQQIAEPDVKSIPARLVEFANAAGGRDNITVVVVEIEADPASVPAGTPSGADIQVRLDALASVFLFEGLPTSHLVRLLSACHVKSFEPGDTVVREGELWAKLIIPVSGRLSLLWSDGRHGSFGPGGYAGITTLFKARSARATICAEEPTRVLCLELEAFRAVVRARPWIGATLLERLGQRLSQDIDRWVEAYETSSGDQLPMHAVDLG